MAPTEAEKKTKFWSSFFVKISCKIKRRFDFSRPKKKKYGMIEAENKEGVKGHGLSDLRESGSGKNKCR
jgi:hypothetical protein